MILSRPWFILAVATLAGASFGFGFACAVLFWKG